jgi:hypothetical protein
MEGNTMTRFIPYEKLSKRAKRELDGKRRGTGGAINPVTRTPENPKAFNRAKQKQQTFKQPPAVFVCAFMSQRATAESTKTTRGQNPRVLMALGFCSYR